MSFSLRPLKKLAFTLFVFVITSCDNEEVKPEDMKWKSIYQFHFQDATGWFEDIDMIDQQTGFISGTRGIYKTTDGGITWNKLSPIPDSQLYIYGSDWRKVFFLNANVGWAVNFKTIIKTTDGGNSWSVLLSGNVFENKSVSYWGGIAFSDADHGVVIGDGGSILYTENGGGTWHWAQTQNNFNSTNFVSLSFQQNKFWVCGQNNAVLKSSDHGKTWTTLHHDVYIPNDPSFQKEAGVGIIANRYIQFVDENTGWIHSSAGTYRSTDGGTTWSKVRVDGTSTVALSYDGADAFFIDANTGYISYVGTGNAGSASGAYYTSNAGQSWANTSADYGMRAFDFITPELGWAISAGTMDSYVLKLQK